MDGENGSSEPVAPALSEPCPAAVSDPAIGEVTAGQTAAPAEEAGAPPAASAPAAAAPPGLEEADVPPAASASAAAVDPGPGEDDVLPAVSTSPVAIAPSPAPTPPPISIQTPSCELGPAGEAALLAAQQPYDQGLGQMLQGSILMPNGSRPNSQPEGGGGGLKPRAPSMTPTFEFPPTGGLFSTMRVTKKQATLRTTMAGNRLLKVEIGAQGPIDPSILADLHSDLPAAANRFFAAKQAQIISGAGLSQAPPTPSLVGAKSMNARIGSDETPPIERVRSGEFDLNSLLPSTSFGLSSADARMAQNISKPPSNFGAAPAPWDGDRPSAPAGFASRPMSRAEIGMFDAAAAVAAEAPLEEDHPALAFDDHDVLVAAVELQAEASKLHEAVAAGRGPSENGAAAAAAAAAHEELEDKLLATYRYQELTEDGGVALTFNLPGLSDFMTTNIDDLVMMHEALEEVINQENLEASELVADEGSGMEAMTDTPRIHPTVTSHQLSSVVEADEDPSVVTPASGELKDIRPPSPKQRTSSDADGAAVAAPAAGKSPRGSAAGGGGAAAAVLGPSPRPSMQGVPPPATRSARGSAAGDDLGVGKKDAAGGAPALHAVADHRAEELAIAAAAAAVKATAEAAAAKAEVAKADLTQSIRVGFVKGKLKPLNIVLMVVGTRGDVQPFIGIGMKLKEFGHRVRIASHKVYREFVETFGLEFYPIGGDPKVLSEFVVKHRGIMPGFHINDALQQREQVREIMFSTWGACVNADPANPTKPFRADAIVANPPSYGHIHCAEKLNVPLHIVFTMPWTPTKLFPQPFARIKTVMGEQSSKAREIMNWLSYFAIEDLAWLGMAGMVKHLRQNVFGLKTWNKFTNSHALYHSKVPITYIWSPSLVPRPTDWGQHIEVVGFINVELKKLTSYSPDKELSDFLAAGPAPVYIGFGSLVVDDPVKLTAQFLEAIKRTGLRAIIQRGWGGLGAGVDGDKTPEGVLFIDSAPHDWLFERVSCVVHHGGAGTTATGLYAGKPTFIVPFFGDQPFWGAACSRAGVGPDPVAIDDLNTERIVNALKELILPTRQKAALKLMALMHAEDGIKGTVDHLHRTIYGALKGGKQMMWMRPEAGEAAEGGGGAQLSTAIRAVETSEGGMLSGFLRMSKRAFGAAPPANAKSPSSNGQSKAAIKEASKAAVSTRPAVPIAEEGKRKSGGFFSFLGC